MVKGGDKGERCRMGGWVKISRDSAYIDLVGHMGRLNCYLVIDWLNLLRRTALDITGKRDVGKRICYIPH